MARENSSESNIWHIANSDDTDEGYIAPKLSPKLLKHCLQTILYLNERKHKFCCQENGRNCKI